MQNERSGSAPLLNGVPMPACRTGEESSIPSSRLEQEEHRLGLRESEFWEKDSPQHRQILTFTYVSPRAAFIRFKKCADNPYGLNNR